MTWHDTTGCVSDHGSVVSISIGSTCGSVGGVEISSTCSESGSVTTTATCRYRYRNTVKCEYGLQQISHGNITQDFCLGYLRWLSCSCSNWSSLHGWSRWRASLWIGRSMAGSLQDTHQPTFNVSVGYFSGREGTTRGQILLDGRYRSSPGSHQQLGRWVRTASQWYRSTAPAPGKSPVSPGSRQSTARRRNPRAYLRSSVFLSSTCTLQQNLSDQSMSWNSSQSLTLHFCSISPVHFLKQCCCSGQ